MKRLDYLGRLSLAARWFMPYMPARDFIEDYSELISELDGPEEALRRFGNPVRLVKNQGDRKKIWRWHLIFGFLLFCLFFPIAAGTIVDTGVFYRSHLYLDVLVCGLVFFCGIYVILLGGYEKPLRICLTGALCLFTALIFGVEPHRYLTAAVDYIRMEIFPLFFSTSADMDFDMGDIYIIACGIALVYFGFGRRNKPGAMSRPLLWTIIALPVLMAVVWMVMYYLYQVNIYPLAKHPLRASMICALGVILFILLALLSLILARMYDPRWRSVFIMALMFVMVFSDFIHSWSVMGWEDTSLFLIGNFNQPEFFAGVEDYLVPFWYGYYGKTFLAFEYKHLFDHLIIGGIMAVIGFF